MSLLLLFAATAHAGRLTGTVQDGSGEPVGGAYIQATSGQPPEVVAQGETNGNGQYGFEVPAGLVALSVTARGYYTVQAGGLESESITRTCPDEGDCEPVDFVLGRNSVVEGWLTDRFGDPVAGIPLSVRPADESTAQSRRPSPGRPSRMPTVSDDRGYFRIWDLRPGRYVLETDPRMRRFPGRGAPVTVPPQEFEIAEPGETVPLRIGAGSSEGQFTISGIIEGVKAPEGRFPTLAIMPKTADQRAQFSNFSAIRDGRFSIGGLRKGEYVLRYVEAGPMAGLRGGRILAELTVDRDITDLRLTPQPPSGVKLSVNYGDIEKIPLSIRIEPVGAGLWDFARIEGPEYEATLEGLLPGEYKLRLYSNEFYLKEPYRFSVQAGQVTPHTVVLGDEFSSLRGRVRVAAGEERSGASHFAVGVRNDLVRMKMQADEEGRFEFEKLAPGAYEVAAWSKPDVDVEDDRVWDDAASRISEIQLDPGFSVEIDLTAVP